MRALVQRVSRSAVEAEGFERVQIGKGLLILLGVGSEDTADDVRFLADKCAHLRIFEDEHGKMNRSLMEVGGEAMVISQFTLYGDTRKGRRPSFMDAADPEIARTYYEKFVEVLRGLGVLVKTGEFGAHMEVELCNDGPVTLMLESPG